MAPRIGGIMVTKNQGHRLLSNVLYHLDVAGFDQLIVVENDSFDGSYNMLQALNHPKLEVIRTGPKPFKKEEFIYPLPNRLATKYACDWIFPIDTDYIWVAVNEIGTRMPFRAALDGKIIDSEPSKSWMSGTTCYKAHLYTFYPHWSFMKQLDEDPELLKSYKEQWWKYTPMRRNSPGTVKSIMSKDVAIRGGAYKAGEHACTASNGSLIQSTMVPDGYKVGYSTTYGIRCYENSMLTHDDFVRKTLNIGLGRYGYVGYEWLADYKNDKCISLHIRKWLRRLMIQGHLRDLMKTLYSVDDETIVAEHGRVTTDEKFVYDTSLMDIDIDVPEEAASKETRLIG